MAGPQTVFKIEVLRRLENTILNLILGNNRAILLIVLSRIYRKHIMIEYLITVTLSYPKSKREIFKMEVLPWLESAFGD